MTQIHSFDPATGHGLRHDPIKAIVAPRPIGWISSLDADGVPNLSPYSFFNMISGAPPILMFSSDGFKDTVANIASTGEFVFNLATRPLAEAMNASSGDHGPEVDEFIVAGLEKAASDRVAPPRVASTPAAMECKLIEIRQLRDIEGNMLANRLVVGQIVRVHIAAECLVDGLFDIARARTIARCGYRGDFIEAGQTFEMLRPVVKS